MMLSPQGRPPKMKIVKIKILLFSIDICYLLYDTCWLIIDDLTSIDICGNYKPISTKFSEIFLLKGEYKVGQKMY